MTTSSSNNNLNNSNVTIINKNMDESLHKASKNKGSNSATPTKLFTNNNNINHDIVLQARESYSITGSSNGSSDYLNHAHNNNINSLKETNININNQLFQNSNENNINVNSINNLTQNNQLLNRSLQIF